MNMLHNLGRGWNWWYEIALLMVWICGWLYNFFYAGLNFASRNLLDSAVGGTFMEINLGEATKLLDNIMYNYSQWHTERPSTSKKSACDWRD